MVINTIKQNLEKKRRTLENYELELDSFSKIHCRLGLTRETGTS